MSEYKVGDRVKAFHPHMFGVVKHGQILSFRGVYARIDFGMWGIYNVPMTHIQDDDGYVDNDGHEAADGYDYGYNTAADGDNLA